MEPEMKKFGMWKMVSALALALALIISAAIATYGVMQIKGQKRVVSVVGCAKKQIKSDSVLWRGSFTAISPKLPDAYGILKNDLERVKKYLVDNGISEKEIAVLSIETMVNYEPLPNGMFSSRIESYRLTQNVEIRSSNIEKVTDISRNITTLINEGVQFQSYPPQYYYTKIADLKIDMLALATKDARNRAENMAQNANSEIAYLRTARMGVFQITPPNSTDVSDYGINDTSSIMKEITGIVNCEFVVK